MNKNTFSIAKLNDFNVDKVLDNAKKGFKAYQKVINYVPDKIAKKLAKTKFGEKKEKGLKKLDNFLQKNPKLKRVLCGVLELRRCNFKGVALLGTKVETTGIDFILNSRTLYLVNKLSGDIGLEIILKNPSGAKI